VEGYNHYVETQGKDGINLAYTVTFNTTNKVIRELSDIPNAVIDTQDYRATGGTALYDAIGQTVQSIDQLLTSLTFDWKVIVNIITDGEENASRHFSQADIQHLIQDHTEKGWLFMYAGAHEKAQEEGTKINIPVERIIRVRPNREGIKNSYDAFNNASTMFKQGK
jgi:uncharacterized protein YegL